MGKIGKANRYAQIIERVFFSHYRKGQREFTFSRDELLRSAEEASIQRPKNIGDLVYSFRYRYELPDSIKEKAPEGLN